MPNALLSHSLFSPSLGYSNSFLLVGQRATNGRKYWPAVRYVHSQSGEHRIESFINNAHTATHKFSSVAGKGQQFDRPLFLSFLVHSKSYYRSLL